MKNVALKITVAALGVAALVGVASRSVRAQDDDDRRPVRFATRLSTFNEVPPKGTGASGTFQAELSKDGTTLTWTFTWTGLTGPPLFAHIHFGQKNTNSQVMTFFCGGPAGNPDVPAKPACPQTTSGTITGTTTAADIVALNTAGANDQGLNVHDFATFLRALRAGDGYANMHTTRFPGGEIRGQVSMVRGDDDDE
jgi:hypothetical protein